MIFILRLVSLFNFSRESVVALKISEVCLSRCCQGYYWSVYPLVWHGWQFGLGINNSWGVLGSIGVKLLQGYGIRYTPKVAFDWIWKTNIPPKIRFFIWKICLDGLPSKDQLERSHIFISQECVFCDFHKENDFQLFCDCSFAHNVFAKLHESLHWPIIPIFYNNIIFCDNVARMRDKLIHDEICKVFII